MRRTLLVLLLVFSPQFFFAQGTAGVEVRVLFTNGHPCNLPATVNLLSGSSSTAVAHSFSDTDGIAQFSAIASGSYTVEVSGPGLQASRSLSFEVGSRSVAEIDVVVRRAGENGPTQSSALPISASDFKIPRRARHEFDQASEHIIQHDWQRAIEHLENAVRICPTYAQAYNNLGVAYGELGDMTRQREALEKAVAANDHFAPAFLNLAKMDLADGNFSAAEALLNKASAADPGHVPTLVLLAQVQFQRQEYDSVIATCHKVHLLAHGSSPLVHYLAAQALEQQQRKADAVRELQTFLAEKPLGGDADTVRHDLTRLENEIAAKDPQAGNP